MKFVSPAQRGTTCRWTWSTTPAPAMRPRFQPMLNPWGPIVSASAARPGPRGDGSRRPLRPRSRRTRLRGGSGPPSDDLTRTDTCSRRRTRALPRWITNPSSSSPSRARQKKQPSCSSAPWMYSRRQGAHSCFTAGSQPLTPAEEGERAEEKPCDQRQDHDESRRREAEVHAENAGEERQRQKDHREDGEDLDAVLLAMRDDRFVRLLERLDDLFVVVQEVPDRSAASTMSSK